MLEPDALVSIGIDSNFLGGDLSKQYSMKDSDRTLGPLAEDNKLSVFDCISSDLDKQTTDPTSNFTPFLGFLDTLFVFTHYLFLT